MGIWSHPSKPTKPPAGPPQRHPHVTWSWGIALVPGGGWETGGGEHGLAPRQCEVGWCESIHGAVTWAVKTNQKNEPKILLGGDEKMGVWWFLWIIYEQRQTRYREIICEHIWVLLVYEYRLGVAKTLVHREYIIYILGFVVKGTRF